MTRARIVYQDWIVQLGHDPDFFPEDRANDLETEAGGTSVAYHQESVSQETEQAVAQAMQTLTEDEQEFIARFHFMGESYQEIAEKSGRIIHKLEALHKRALRKLKQALADFAHNRYRLSADQSLSQLNQCVICSSDFHEEINQLINQKSAIETWRPIIRQLRVQYGISIRSPQVLIGHQKYHRVC